MPIYKRTLQSGQMINNVSLQNVVITKDVYNAPVRTWVPVFNSKASLTSNGTSEYYTGTREEASLSVTCVMRVNPNFNVLSSWRVVEYGTDINDILATYAIKSISYDPKRTIMVLELTSGVADG